MNSIQQLLETLGPPPAEVCLDWAWQLVSLAEESMSDIESGRRSVRSHSLAPSWSSVLIDAQGQLSLSSPSTSECGEKSIAELVQQLMEWFEKANVHSPLLPLDFPRQATSAGTAATLEEQRRSLSQLIATLQWDAPPANQGIFLSTTMVVAEQPTDAIEAPLQDASCSKSVAEPPLAPAGSSRLSKLKRRKRIPPVMLWGGAALGLTATVSMVLFWPRGEQNDGLDRNLASLQSADTAATNRAEKNPLEPQRSPAGKGNVNSSEAELTLDSAGELTTLDATLENAAVKGSSELTVDPAEALSNLGPIASHLDLQDSAAAEHAADAAASQPAGLTESMAKPSDNATPAEDVASMLAAASMAEPKVNSIDPDLAAAGPPKLPCQLLDIDSMLQVQEISAKIRVRQPVWQLRIASTDEFSVDPPGVQSLAEKQTVRWILTAKEIKPHKDQEPTQVIVMAQLAGRRADIKWKIAAGCVDLPSIAVPLDGARLDKMLNMLQDYQQRLAAGVANIKESVELPGLVREQKSLLNAQRKAMENEGKLVTRARQIIADAGMFVSWLDRSLEMHGNLIDQIGGQSVTVLQIGNPEQ